MEFFARFHLIQQPFTREIQVSQLFRTPVFTTTLQGLVETCQQRMSGAIVAPPGTGKTALARAVHHELPEARYRVHYVKLGGLSKRDVCRELCAALGLETAGHYPSLVRRIQESARTLVDTEGRRPVLILDEAHELKPDVLSMFRIVTHFDMDARLVLSLLFIGQPPLAERLRQQSLEDLAQRLAFYVVLRPLSRDETRQYIHHRCTIAGAPTCPFNDGACNAIYEMGRGNLRATDRIALKSLQVAHQLSHSVVDETDVIHARRSLWPN